MERDLEWDAIMTVAGRLDERAKADDRPVLEERLHVVAQRKRSLSSWSVTEGLYAGNLWTDVFEPVRRRRLFGRRWQPMQPVPGAASKIGQLLRERPDLGFDADT